MYKIFTPQSNSNDEFVFIAEWKFKNNEFVKKGDHLLSVETSKVVEEIFSENEGYLEKLYDENSKVKVGEVVGILNDKKKLNLNKNLNNKSTVFTVKAKNLIQKHNLDESLFNSENIIKEKEVLDYLKKNKKVSLSDEDSDQLIILFKKEEPYHSAIYIKDLGIIDLSLLGSKITKKEEYNFAGCKCNFFKLKTKNKEEMVNFLKEPAVLTEKIIKKEKSSKGWAMKAESANYILKFRNSRSKNIEDMNCIEWLVHGLEIGGIQIPEDVLTADRLKIWAEKKLIKVDKKNNLEIFQSLY